MEKGNLIEERINGLDTLKLDISMTPPKSVGISFNAMKALQEAQTIANIKWIGLIPYCLVCKMPLIWIRNSEQVFECPKCGMRWDKLNGWGKTKEKVSNGKG
jgi:ribosomal protein L37AE/L43A